MRNGESISLCKTKGSYLIESIQWRMNEIVLEQDTQYKYYNVEMVNNNNLYENILRHQNMSLQFLHLRIEIDIRLPESKGLLIITTPKRLICMTNVSLIPCYVLIFGCKVSFLYFINKIFCNWLISVHNNFKIK